MDKKTLYLIDATAFCYRAFYALPALSTSYGQPTNAIYGFVNILHKILKSHKPDYLAACFDVSRDTFRTKKFAEYKIHRPPMPDALASQLSFIKQIIRSYGIPLFEKEGFEADDLIATIASFAKKNGLRTIIVSSDKDILQLVDETVYVFSPHKDEGLIYDRKMVTERFGVGPERVTDIIALMGDDVDNIPGVPGIGEKTAINLILQHGSLDNMFKHIPEIKTEKLRRLIEENKERIILNRELTILDANVNIGLTLESLRVSLPDYKALFDIFKRLELKKFLKELPSHSLEVEKIVILNMGDNDINEEFAVANEIFIYGQSASDIFFFVNGKYFTATLDNRYIQNLLSDAKVRKIGHDLKGLKVSLAKDGVCLKGLYFDTMISAYLLNPSRTSYALSELAMEYLGAHISETTSSPEKLLETTVRLQPILDKELQDKSLYDLFNTLEMPLVEVLAEMELSGIKLDLDLIKRLSHDIDKRLASLVADIYASCGCQFNLNSPKQLREVLFGKLKLPVTKKGKTGPSTDEEVLRNLASRHSLPALLLEYRQLAKLKNTYIDALPALVDKKTGKIHTSFNQTGTETGRISSSNPNLQNIPVKTDIGKKMRQAVTASGKDNYLLSCDYSQIELRILAHLSKDEALLDAFRKDMDVHRMTAALIYNVDESLVSAEMRETAKRVNFGIIYGLTSYGLSRDLGIPVEEAQRFIDAYFLRYPGVRGYIETQIKKAKKEGFVTTILGRRRYLPEINNKTQVIRQFAERQAVNTPIQGSASDLIKLAMIDIHRRFLSGGFLSKMVLQIHDELVFDVVEKELSEVKELVKDRMEHVLKLDLPIKVEIKKGKNWLEMEPV
ncbi:MAG: DNA polymerase I [Candidatus Omnitrophica bacterium]|nr:DNA polymerase I [Candidatus Omnitrophota bacterium]